MTGFDDVTYAGKFRDLVSRIARKVVKEERPDVRIGKVFSYDPVTNSALIYFPGDTVENLTRVRVAADRCPTSTMIETFGEAGYDAAANIVRVWGKPGDYFILDYYAGVPFSNAPSTGGEPTIPNGLVTQYWRGDKTWQTLDKASVGLSLVDNTSDAGKPLSTASSNALADKVSKTIVESIGGRKTFNAPVNLLEQTSTPSTPSGSGSIYVRDNFPYYLGPDAIERPFFEPREALHQNPNFEDPWTTQSTGGGYSNLFPSGWHPYWTNAGVTYGQSTDRVSGNYSVRMSRPASIGQPYARAHGANAFSLVPGSIVTFTIAAKSLIAGSPWMDLHLYTAPTAGQADLFATDPLARMQVKTVQPTTTWTRFTVQFVVPAGGEFGRFSVGLNAGNNLAFDLLIDDSGSSSVIPLANGVIPGEVKLWPTNITPAGYLKCDGSSYANTLYPDLAAVLENKYGGVVGTSFAVPNMEANGGMDSGWIPVTFQNSWIDYGADYATAAYRRVGSKVMFRGLVKSGTVGTTMFTLPYGFRIANGWAIFSGVNNTKNTGAASTGTAHTHPITDAAWRINVNSNGTVGHGAGGANGYVDLSQIEFETTDPWMGDSNLGTSYVIKT